MAAIDIARVPERAQAVAELSEAALRWFETSKSLPGETAVLRRHRREARRLNLAATRSPTVAVFGASQAGKSYLIGSLARSPDRPLTVRYGTTTLDFLRDLNPAGAKESTGLVSRFTVRPPDPPAGAPPVPVRLISRGDVIRIVANTYLSDFQLREPPLPEPEETGRLLASLGGGGGSGFDVDDIEELAQYFKQHLHSTITVQKLGNAYWLQLAEIIDRLSPAAVVKAFSPLWGGFEEFSRLAERLLDALDHLGAAGIAFCELAALQPRSAGILNVNALFGLGKGGGETVRVVGENGRSAAVEKSVLAAIVAELVIPLERAPWPFLERVDLLDFPGARTREIIEDGVKIFADPNALGHTFLRGKVEFLFQRYEMEGEITAMLLCVGDSVQEVQTLPRMVDRWVGSAIGVTPQERSAQRDRLFLVLTKFDREFEQKAGEDQSADERWTARIQASLTDFFKTCSWVSEWKPGRPFANVSWLRSTAVEFPAVFDYVDAPSGRCESQVAARAEGMVAAKRTAYLGNELIGRHVSDPARAWDEALRPADGGISYLAERLDPVCDRAAKLEQVGAQLEKLAVTMAAQLRPHHRSGDADLERRKAYEQVRKLAGHVTKCAEMRMFGPLLRAFTVSRDGMIAVWRAMQAEPEAALATAGPTSDASELFSAMFGGTEEVALTATALDRHERFARMAIAEWTRQMNAFAAEPAVEKVFRLPAEQAATMVATLIATASRLDVVGRLAAKLRETCSHHSRITSTGEKQSALATAAIGDFVTLLGYAQTSDEERPFSLDDKRRRVFAPRQPVAGLPTLDAQPATYTARFLFDWISALLRRAEENAGAPDFGEDPEANARLGAILAGLEKAA